MFDELLRQPSIQRDKGLGALDKLKRIEDILKRHKSDEDQDYLKGLAISRTGIADREMKKRHEREWRSRRL
jgi:hypothetical protein